MKFTKGQIVYLGGMAEFEGEVLPAVIPCKVALVVPQRSGPPKYNVFLWEPLKPKYTKSFSSPEADLHKCPVAAMSHAIQAVYAAVTGQKTGAANG
jgi:hypothetical protein